MTDCLFCKIISGHIPAEYIHQDEEVVVFKDKYPKAKVHVLVVSRRHIPSLFEAKDEDKALLGTMMRLVSDVARGQGLEEGFRVIVNTGRGGGQEINHLHFHIVGGGCLPFV
ncbi:MAG: histidine triad nucleotide-binding protein [Gammaproteobacteria bacterium]|nr:histidine triad nucleotide-binding protein [Gammaproteobacteria bacterium]